MTVYKNIIERLKDDLVLNITVKELKEIMGSKKENLDLNLK